MRKIVKTILSSVLLLLFWHSVATISPVSAAIDRYVGFFSPPATWTVGQDANPSIRMPDPRNGDLMLASIAVRPATATIDTPSGWTLLNYTTATDSDVEGENTGSVGFYWFYKTADGTEGTGNQTFTKQGTISVWTGNIMQIRSATRTYEIVADSLAFNGDATAWTGQLATDIGMLDGDLIILGAAQNGNLSNTGTWNITATNVTNKSTVNEHGEFTTATGNNVEVGLSTTQVWQGNNTVNPTITVTQSAATSGVYTAVRVRQGSGTKRTDSWVRAAGKQVAGTTSVATPYPEHDIGDLLVLIVGSRATGEPTPTTPTGWNLLGTYSGGAGTYGGDSGPSRMTVFYRQAAALYTGTVTTSIPSGNTAIGQIVAIHKDNIGSWTLDSDGGIDSTAGTSWSVTGTGIDLDSANGGDIVLAASSINTDQVTGYSAHAMSATGGVTFGDVTQTGEFITSGGNDMGIDLANGRVASGSGTVTPTFTMTSPATSGNYPAGSTMFIKISGSMQNSTETGVGFFSPARVWTAAADGPLNLPYPDPRNGDLLIASIVVRPSASTVDTPSGWTAAGSWSGTDGAAEGADTGSVSVYWFYKIANGTEGTGTQQFTEQGTTSVWQGAIMQARSSTGTYSVSSGGYSINGDATNWGGTLDTDIGLQSGDLVIMAAVQNGDLAGTSAQSISATGVTDISTITKHGEFGSSTGNAVEVAIAAGQIWEGTSSANPTVTTTQGTATSGAVSVLRVRQGTGTVRTDTWVKSAGAQVAGSTTLAVPYPEHEVGDLLVLFIGSRHPTDDAPLPPSDWTLLGTYNGGAGTFATDAGNGRITAYYREVTSRRYNTQTVTIPTGTNQTSLAEMLSLQKSGATSWSLDVDGGSDTDGTTSWSVSGSGIDLDSADGGDIVLVGSSINTDPYTFTGHALSATGGITFGEVTQTTEYRSTTGNDMDMIIATGRVASGSGTGVTPTYSMTSSGSATNRPAGSSLMVKILGNASASTITVSGTANGNEGQTVKVAINGVLQGETGTISSGTWSISSVDQPANGDIVTVFVDNVSDSNETTGITKYTSGDITSMVLNTNTLTIGSSQNQSLSVTDLGNYDCSQDEDVMHESSSNTLEAEGSLCAGSTSNTYSSERLSILASNTLTTATSDEVITHDIAISGSITVTGNTAFTLSGSWTNTGSFSKGTSTVTFAAASGSETLDNTGASSHAFHNVATSSGVTLTLSSATTIDNDLTVGTGTSVNLNNQNLDVNGGNITTVGSGNITCSGCSSGTVTLAGDGTTNGLGGGGSITVWNLHFDGSSNTTSIASSSVTVLNDLTIGSGRTVQGNSGGTLYVARNWSNGGTFSANSSTVTLNGSGGTTQAITGATVFYNLVATTSLARTIEFEALTTFTVQENLTLTGTSCSELLTLASSSPGNAWSLDDDSGGTSSVNYVDVSYSIASDQTIVATNSQSGNTTNWTASPGVCGTLSTNIVDESGDPVANPFVILDPAPYSLVPQETSGTFGVTSQRIRVTTTDSDNWSLTISADSPLDVWESSTLDYDFNDPTGGVTDGGDADSVGGQLTMNPSVGTLSGTCSTTGVSKGSSTAFSEGIVNSISLLIGTNTDTACYLDLIGVELSQTIPLEQPAASDYNIDMTLTITAY